MVGNYHIHFCLLFYGLISFPYSPLGKAFEKQTKFIEDQGEKQIKTIKNRVEERFLDTDKTSNASLFSKDFLNEEATYGLNKIVEI